MNHDPTQLHPELYRLRPWYHDFSTLGVETIFPIERPPLSLRIRNLARKLLKRPTAPYVTARSHHFLVNQRCKEPVIRAFLERALAALGAAPRCLELFCADGYYACLLKRLCPEATVVGVDLADDDVRRAMTVARLLGFQGLDFIRDDVASYLDREEDHDLILCAGGLYHLSRPMELIEKIARHAPRRVLIQSVVTLETEDPGYFVTPAPGWRHGSRFTHARLRSWLEASGLRILEEDRNTLDGNRSAADRGSSYFLCAAGGST